MKGIASVSAYEQHVEGVDYNGTIQLNIYTIFDYYKKYFSLQDFKFFK